MLLHMALKDRIRRLVAPAIRRISAKALTHPTIRQDVMRSLFANYTVGNIPALEGKHLDEAQLFADRKSLISSLRSIEGGFIAEVGVAEGDFSEFLLNELKPTLFVAFDIFNFNMQEWGAWGQTTAKLFNGISHLDFYKRRFADRGSQVVIEVGMSHSTLAKYPDRFFDLIYLDANHTYEYVKNDAELAKSKIKERGFIIFNDYIQFDHINGIFYGVLRAVNELIVNDNWVVCGFALQREMFCDIAIRKR
jgi:hypothetical protein